MNGAHASRPGFFKGSRRTQVVIAKDGNSFPGLIFVPVPEGKTSKNRLHIDLNPENQEAEVERLTGLGARRIDIGQGDVTWVVMADPEGNEFCVCDAAI